MLDYATAEYMVERIGSSISRLMSELDKLQTYAKFHDSTKIDKTVVDQVAYGEVESDTFALLDNLYRSEAKSLSLVDTLRDSGVNWNQVIGGLYRGVRVLILYANCLKRKI